MNDYTEYWDGMSEENIGRDEAYKLSTDELLTNLVFYKSFENTDDNKKLQLLNIATKRIATWKDAAKVELHIKKLVKSSGFTKQAIMQKIKDEKYILSLRAKEEIKKQNKYFAVKELLKVTDYSANVERFYDEQPFFYDKYKIFWMWNKDEMKYEIIDEIDIMNKFDTELGLYGQTITSGIKNNYIEAMRRIGRIHLPKDAPTKWIQFKDKAYSIKSGKVYDVTPDYFFTNPIPFRLGTSESTPTMDKLFSEWVDDNSEVLYEILAYCLYREYPIQMLFCLYGSGANGKTQFLAIMEKFLGTSNCTAVELISLIENRFDSFKLYKKLVCQIGETDFSIIRKSSLLKKLVDGSLIGFEKKNKDPFEDRNYAKIVIASNSVPSSDDTSDGWYRRWFIVDFPHQFEEIGYPVWKSVPDEEYSNLALKLCHKLKDLLKRGRFTNQGTMDSRKERYISVSNPLASFVSKSCRRGDNEFESYSKVFTSYINFLAKRKQRRVKPKEFKSALEDEGFYVEKTTRLINGEYKNGYYIIGLSLKVCDICDNYDNNLSLFSSTDIKEVQKPVIMVTSVTNTETITQEELVYNSSEIENKIYHKCYRCGKTPIEKFVANQAFCQKCLLEIQPK